MIPEFYDRFCSRVAADLKSTSRGRPAPRKCPQSDEGFARPKGADDIRKSRLTEAKIAGINEDRGSDVKRLIEWVNRSVGRTVDGHALPEAWVEPCDVRFACALMLF